MWISLRPVQNFNDDNLWGHLSSAIQSGNEFNISDRISIHCAIVRGVAGRGPIRLAEETVMKRSILSIKNNDNLCLPRSLVAAYAYVIRGQIRTGTLHNYWNLIRRDNGPTQKRAAEELLNLVKVRLPTEGCGLEEIHLFQIFFATHGTASVFL